MLHWGWERGTPYGEAQVVDQTCEIAYWFYVVARQMETLRLEMCMLHENECAEPGTLYTCVLNADE